MTNTLTPAFDILTLNNSLVFGGETINALNGSGMTLSNGTLGVEPQILMISLLGGQGPFTSGQTVTTTGICTTGTFLNNFAPSVGGCATGLTVNGTIEIEFGGTSVASMIVPSGSTTGTITSSATLTTLSPGELAQAVALTGDQSFNGVWLTIAGTRSP